MLRRNYFAKGWRDRCYDEAVVVKKDEAKQEIKGQPLTDMLFVNVKSELTREDPKCYIYGHISVKIGQSQATLFSRDRQAPALVFIGDIFRNSLTLPDLPDDDASPPPLEAVTQSTPMLITMKLHEKNTSSGKDKLLIDVKDFEHREDVKGRCSGFEIDLGEEIWFGVGFAVMTGARAEIKVKIKTPPGSKSPAVPIKAKIEAIQYLRQCHSCCGQAVRTLYDQPEEVYVGDGEELPLQHSIIGLPMVDEQFLSILIRPYTDVQREPVYPLGDEDVQDEDEKHPHYLVDLPLDLDTEMSFMTNSESTHTKDVLGAPFSVSIKILPLPDPEVTKIRITSSNGVRRRGFSYPLLRQHHWK